MNTKNFLLGGIVGFVFIFLYEWVVHGMALMSTYEATSDVWRPMAEMETMMPFSIFTKLALAFAMAWYVAKRHIHTWKVGAHFGCMIGVFFAISSLTQYVYLPIDLSLSITWAVAILVQMTVLGAIAGYFNAKH